LSHTSSAANPTGQTLSIFLFSFNIVAPDFRPVLKRYRFIQLI